MGLPPRKRGPRIASPACDPPATPCVRRYVDVMKTEEILPALREINRRVSQSRDYL